MPSRPRYRVEFEFTDWDAAERHALVDIKDGCEDALVMWASDWDFNATKLKVVRLEAKAKRRKRA